MRRCLPTNFSFIEGSSISPQLVQSRFVSLLLADAAARGQKVPDVLGTDHHTSNHRTSSGRGTTTPLRITVAEGTHVWVRLRLRDPIGASDAFSVRLKMGVESAEPPVVCFQLAWFPSALGWQLSTPRKELQLYTILGSVRTQLERLVLNGRVNRQELGSMLPPLLLDVRAGNTVLDLCAAPGSKTVLLLSLLRGASRRECASGASGAHMPSTEADSGCVVANDLITSRARKMRLRLGPMRTPTLILVSHKAQEMPGAHGSYARVLCDVPCSGDATLRKNPTIWDKWKPSTMRQLHSTQLAILGRGIQLLAPGGKLLYSTCSFSPVENEAVVAAAIVAAQAEGLEVRLLPLPGALPGLHGGCGLRSWRVPCEHADAPAVGLGSWEDATAEQRRRCKLLPSMFPPSAAAAEALHLEHCLRILPHLLDSGGFFCALLHKMPQPDQAMPPKQAATGQSSERAPSILDPVGRAAAAGREAAGNDPPATPIDAPATPIDRNPQALQGARRRRDTRFRQCLSAPFFACARPRVPPVALERARTATVSAPPHVEAVQTTVPAPTPQPAPAPQAAPTAEEVAADAAAVAKADAAVLAKAVLKKAARLLAVNTPWMASAIDEAMEAGEAAEQLDDGRRDQGSEGGAGGADEGAEDGGGDAGRTSCWFIRFYLLPRRHRVIESLEEFYGLSPNFPWAQLFSCQSNGPSRRLSLMTRQAAQKVEEQSATLAILQAGIKAFERDDSQGVGCQYRIPQEGVLAVLPYMSKRVVRVPPLAFAALLQSRQLDLDIDLDDNLDLNLQADAEARSLAHELRGARSKLRALEPNGCCVLSSSNVDGSAFLAAVAMKYTDQLVLFVGETERLQLLEDVAVYCL